MSLLNHMELHLLRHLHTSFTRRYKRRALQDAFALFMACHGPWANSYFDLPFLTGIGAEALLAKDANALARAWTLQFYYREQTQRDRDIKCLTPVAQSIIDLFTAAWQPYDTLLTGQTQAPDRKSALQPSAPC
jgi:hypothetical protein